MSKINTYLLLLLTIIPIVGCNNSNKSINQLDNKSYINDFELIQESPYNDTRLSITSPKAILDPTNNDIEIFDSSIVFLNNNGNDIRVDSGNSILNNLNNYIKVFNNVDISFLGNVNYFINTDSFNWNLNTSIIDIDNPLNIYINDTKIVATNGFYNIDKSLLNIYNSELVRTVFNAEGKQDYKVKIISEFAKWYKHNNTLVFSSNHKQVETTIKVLSIK